jgi:hypothetical protein
MNLFARPFNKMRSKKPRSVDAPGEIPNDEAIVIATAQ